ncbi:[NiFe] hydrogenase metallocenter assembly protein HypD [Cronobacter sakazakii 696]|nr:[NiFe] hydrogenase metallocenter assembly protein HypD [Cronobacter sakazakii 696]
MRYVDEYRNPERVMRLIDRLCERAPRLSHTAQKPLRIMEVCGGHTHAIFKFGLDRLLPENIEFIHGPGCPVCVLPMGRIDNATEIARRPGVIFCTFGDAMRVPGKNGSLLQAKAEGADVRIVYSPMDALKIAGQNPARLQTGGTRVRGKRGLWDRITGARAAAETRRARRLRAARAGCAEFRQRRQTGDRRGARGGATRAGSTACASAGAGCGHYR